MKATIKRLTVFPIKSLDGCSVEEATISSGGSLKHDREFAFFGLDGRTVNAKKFPKIQQIRTEYDLGQRLVTFASPEMKKATFHLDEQQDEIEEWVANALQTDVILKQNLKTGFPDDQERSGPTIVSTESLLAVGQWYSPQLELDEVRRRFRSNIELTADAPPFWEDQLVGSSIENPRRFKIDDVDILGVKPCPRCPVPTRNSLNGEPDNEFQTTFESKRKETAIPSIDVRHFPHFYMLAINTVIPLEEGGKNLKLGDSLAWEQV